MSEALATAALDAAYSVFGVPATYTPPAGGGAAVAFTGTLVKPDVPVPMGGGGRFIAQTRVVRARVSELASPAKGGIIVLGGETLKIVQAPRREDDLRLEWTLEVDRA